MQFQAVFIANLQQFFRHDGIPGVEIRPGIDKLMQDYMGRIAEIDTVYRYDPSLWEIVEAEASRFYGGQLTAQQTGEAIQSRVKIYLAEQG